MAVNSIFQRSNFDYSFQSGGWVDCYQKEQIYMKIKLNNPFQTVALLMAILKLNGQSFKFEIPKSVKVKEFKR